MARRLYNGLGFYLHARVDQRDHDFAKLRKKIEKILPRLEQFRGDRIIMSGIHPRTTAKCEFCGRSMGKRVDAITENPFATCPKADCGAVYNLTDVGAGKIEWKLVQQNLVCRACGADNWLGIHEWKQGAAANSTITCSGCGIKYQLFEYVMVKDYEPEAEPEAGTA